MTTTHNVNFKIEEAVEFSFALDFAQRGTIDQMNRMRHDPMLTEEQKQSQINAMQQYLEKLNKLNERIRKAAGIDV